MPSMGDSALVPVSASAVSASTAVSRHSALVRVTHWITTLCFFALLVSGVEIVISHPRFYWGETGNDLTTPLFSCRFPPRGIWCPPATGMCCQTRTAGAAICTFKRPGYVVLTGLLYFIYGVIAGHFWKNLLPRGADLSWRAFSSEIADHLRFKRPSEAEAWSYNVLQRLSYLFVIFILFPFVIWTGLAMSPAFVSAFPSTVNVLGRPAIGAHHFISSSPSSLVLFLLVHVVMIFLAGFRSRMRAMITGRADTDLERP